MQGDASAALRPAWTVITQADHVDELLATVEQLAGGSKPARATASTDDPTVVFDERAALGHTGGDRTLLRQMVSMFRADRPASLRRIKAALDTRDGEALRLAAHSLKGALAAIGSPAGRQTAAELEFAGRDGQFDAADRAYQTLVERLARLDESLVSARLVTQRRRPAPGGRKK